MSDLKKLTPFKYFVLTNFPFIEADFDALTNYQLMCEVTKYINQIAERQNETIDGFNNLEGDFNSLVQTWNSFKAEIEGDINELYAWFNNLDVQEEINNKIDEMVANGSLLAVFESTVKTQTASTTASWLTEHITQPTTPVIDSSLTVAGAGADAKVTGDRITEVNEALDGTNTTLNNYLSFIDLGDNFDLPVNENLATQRMGISRYNSKIKLHGRSTTGIYCNLYGNPVRSTLGDVDIENTYPFEADHKYLLFARISGTYSTNGGAKIDLRNTDKEIVHTMPFATSELATKDYLIRTYEFTSDGNPLLILIYWGNGFTNADLTIDFVIVDVTIAESFGILKDIRDANLSIPAVKNDLNSSKKLNFFNLIEGESTPFTTDYIDISGVRKNFIQGMCSDGEKYIYYGLGSGRNAPVSIRKFDTFTKKVVAHIEGDYGHCEGLAYIPSFFRGLDNGSVNRIYVTDLNYSATYPSGKYIHVFNADTLEYITSFETLSLINNTYWNGANRVISNPETGKICLQSETVVNNITYVMLAVFNNNGELIHSCYTIKSAGTLIGMDADINYIYLGRYITRSAEEHTFTIYGYLVDWNLTPVKKYEYTQLNWEIEGVTHIGNSIFCSYNETETTDRKAYIYKCIPIYESYDENVSYPINWSNDGLSSEDWTIIN